MSAPTSATTGARSPIPGQTRAASRAVCRAATTGRTASSCSAPKPIFRFSGADDTFAPFKFSNPWFGTLRGRGGYAYSNFLFYVTAGLAYGGLKGENGLLTESKTQVGWTAGLGAEVGITSNWSAKVEYLYMDLGSRAYSITGTTNGYQANIIRLGVNYHF